jgi:hypothetical protein
MIWIKQRRTNQVLTLTGSEMRIMWATAFATATVQIEIGMWSPQDTRPNDMAIRKILKAEEMADQVVRDYLLLQKEE